MAIFHSNVCLPEGKIPLGPHWVIASSTPKNLGMESEEHQLGLLQHILWDVTSYLG